MDEKTIMDSLRSPDENDYPELEKYSLSERYDYFIGCGGLYLATQMARRMNLKKGNLILDLGSGFGSSSIYLAKEFDVTIVSADLWFHSDNLHNRISDTELKKKIIPLKLDITNEFPFSPECFDAIFCMNSFFFYGDKAGVLDKLAAALKSGGVFCVGSEGFTNEIELSSGQAIPEVYNFENSWNVWDLYSKYHTCKWWGDLFIKNGSFTNVMYENLGDGIILWEDLVKNYDVYINQKIVSSGAVLPKERFLEQIVYGRKTGISPTVYVITGTKVST